METSLLPFRHLARFSGHFMVAMEGKAYGKEREIKEKRKGRAA